MAAETLSVSGRKAIKSTDVTIPICAVCKLDGKAIPAVGMCETCPDDLCEECFTIHCKPKPMRDHVLKKCAFVAEDGTQKWGDISKCKSHENKPIEYYCENHKELGCSQCFVTKHRPCREVVVIADVAATTQNAQEFRRLEADLRVIENKIRLQKPVLVNLREESIKTRKDTVGQAQEYGRQLKMSIDQYVVKQTSQINVIAEQDLKKVAALEEFVGECEKAFVSNKDYIEFYKKCGKPELLYIAMKNAHTSVQKIQTGVKNVIAASEVRKYTFEPGEAVSRPLQIQLQRVHVKSSGPSERELLKNARNEYDSQLNVFVDQYSSIHSNQE